MNTKNSSCCSELPAVCSRRRKIVPNLLISQGFTLIELLVVISIIGVLSSLIVTNLQDSRARARDTRKKQNLQQMKTALRLYYNDYQSYPLAFSSYPLLNYIKGCGSAGTTNCPCSNDADFAAGGTGCDTVYMTSFPDGLGNNTISYYQNGSDSNIFCLKANLENAADPDIQTSIDQCSAACSTAGAGNITSPAYAVCAN